MSRVEFCVRIPAASAVGSWVIDVGSGNTMYVLREAPAMTTASECRRR
jgi:hypothetical protein